MRLGLGLGLTYQRTGGSALTLSQQVQALLLGTTGFALDPTDLTTLWQDTGETIAVVNAADPVRRIKSKWGTPHIFNAPTDAARGAWDGTRFITMDGVDDYYEASAASDVFRNAPGAFVAMRSGGSYGNTQFVLSISTATATGARLVVQSSTGRMRTQVRRLDADSATDNFGTVNTIFAGSTWSFEQDWSVNGNAVKRKDNASIDTYTLAGTPANSENTASARFRLNTHLSTTPTVFQTNSIGRLVFLPRVPTAGERTTIEAWLVEV